MAGGLPPDAAGWEEEEQEKAAEAEAAEAAEASASCNGNGNGGGGSASSTADRVYDLLFDRVVVASKVLREPSLALLGSFIAGTLGEWRARVCARVRAEGLSLFRSGPEGWGAALLTSICLAGLCRESEREEREAKCSSENLRLSGRTGKKSFHFSSVSATTKEEQTRERPFLFSLSREALSLSLPEEKRFDPREPSLLLREAQREDEERRRGELEEPPG